jgi:hypothetical protein
MSEDQVSQLRVLLSNLLPSFVGSFVGTVVDAIVAAVLGSVGFAVVAFLALRTIIRRDIASLSVFRSFGVIFVVCRGSEVCEESLGGRYGHVVELAEGGVPRIPEIQNRVFEVGGQGIHANCDILRGESRPTRDLRTRSHGRQAERRNQHERQQ